MSRKIMKFFKKNFPVFMVVILLAGLVPTGPARADDRVITEVPVKKNEEINQQLVGETVAATTLSWSALSLLDKGWVAAFYQSEKPTAKLSADERYVAINRQRLSIENPLDIEEVITVHDRVTGEADDISLPETEGISFGSLLDFDISDNAQYIAFSYREGLLNEVMKVYVYDRQNDKMELITPIAGENVYGDDANLVSISGNGQFIAFDTEAKGLVPEDQDTFRDVFVYDRLATDNKLKRISSNPDLPPDEVGDSSAPSISSDGRYIAFQSRVNLTDEENDNNENDIYVYESQNSETPIKKISNGLGNVHADGESILPSISANGQAIAFLSEATNLVSGTDENYEADLFVSDGVTIKRVAFVPDITDPEDMDRLEIKRPIITPDGKYVSYELHEATDEDDIIEAYVASVESKISTKVTVPNAPLQVVNPSHTPIAGAGARTVVFNALYERTFGDGTSMDFPATFIASQGSNPTWSPGSTLQATEQPGGLTLTWPDASDSGDILGYQIFQNDAVIGYVPFSAENTFTVLGHDPKVHYQYQVEAVNSQYNVSYGGPTYVKGSGTPVDPVVVLDWDVDRSKNRLPLIGSTVTFSAYMKTGLQGEGTLSYKVLAAGGGTEVRTQTLSFTENGEESGVYHSTFPITEGIVELTSLVVKVVDPTTQEETEQQLAGMPIKIAGNATFDFENPGKADLNGAYLSIRSARLGGEFIVLKGNEPVTIEGLYPDEAYSATLYSSGGMRVYSQKDNIKVSSGGKETITLQVIAPANIRFKMVDTEGKPVENVGVQLFDSTDNYLGSYTSDENGITHYFSHLTAGDQVTAKIDIGDYMFQKVPVQTIELLSGDQEKTITLTPLPVGALEGTVTNSENEPVMNAIVTMQQTVDGKSIVRTTHSSLNGRYKFDNVFEGDVSVEAIETSNKYKTVESLTAKIEAEKTTNLPIRVSQPKTGIINVKVFLKYIDGEWMGPVDMSQMPFFTRIEYQGGGWQTGYYQNAYYYGGYPNRTVKVCVTTTTPSYTSKCVDVTVDENGNATAELHFEEIGGRIQGSLALNDNYSVYGNLYHLSGNSPSWEQHVSSNEFRSNDFNINIMEPGRYRLDLVHYLPTVQNRYEYASVEFTVEDQKITQLGTISFSPTSYFTNMEGNVFTAFPNRVFPGSTVDFRVSYKNVKDKETENASLIVSIPEGLVPIKDNSGKIIVNGIQEEATLEGNNLIIPLGDLASGQSGTVSYKLKANLDFDGFNVRTAARIKATIDGKTIDETLGTILLDTPKVTVEVQDRLTSLQNELTGYAPAGSMVSVYDGNQLVGSTQASETGFWKTNVVLPDIGDPSTHAIYAEATASSVKLRSATVYPDYNTTSPKLLEMAMAQAPDGKWVYLQVEKGISRIPYTVVPNNPFQFELKFDRPDDVHNVYVYVGGQKGEAVRAVRDGNIYKAVTPTSFDALGGIYVSFDEKPIPFTPNEYIPTLDEIRQSMPLNMRDFEVVSTTPFELTNGKYSGQVKFKFPQLGNAIMTVTLSIEPNASYQPSAEEIALAEQSGLPMVNGSISETETEEAFTTVQEGYVPMDLLFPNGLPDGQSNQAKAMSTTLAGGKYGWGAVGHLTTEATMEFTDVLKTGNDIRKSYNDQNDFASRINKIMYKVQMGFDCLTEVPTTVREAGTALVAVVGGEFSKVALGAWAGAMGLTGAPGVAAAAAVYVAEQKIDAYVDSKIDAISSGYNECREDDKKRRKVAEPKWIYDPSGYVYEAVPANRLEGVKATVLYLNPETNKWVVWDAGPYEQINPQTTNGEGKYGWDVPPGKWKVVWEKEGYETQTSVELDVPPPHTEVNAGLISRAAPEVEKVTGVLSATGSYVDVTFSKYLQVADLPNNALAILDPDGKNIAGTAKFVGEVDNPTPSSPKLTRTVRFEVEGALDLSKEYQVKVNPSFFKSYADVWMKEAYNGSFTVVEEDLAGPIPVAATANGMMITLEFNELLSTYADGAKFLINGSEAMVSSAVRDVNNRKLLYLSLNQEIPAGQPIEITVLAGAISDEKGNLSAEYKLSVINQSASDNALLAGLVVESATLSPGFDPNVFSYSVAVANSATHLQITANAADSKARVIIDGMETVSGVAKSVLIPASGEISITLTAEDGTTTRAYLINVNRVVSNDANLSDLTVTPGTITPDFNSQTQEYTVTVGKAVNELQIAAIATNGASSIVMNGEVVTSGSVKTVAIPASGEIIIIVTAEDGITTKMYTINVERTASNDASLSALMVNPGTLAPVFNSQTQEYVVTVSKGVSELQVTATVNEVDASLTINGVAVTSGTAKTVTIPANGKVNVVVTAEDGTTIRTYTITVNFAVSNDATLSGLTVNPGTLAPVFNSNTQEYDVTVGKQVTELQVTATVNEVDASLTINGVAATSATAKTVTIPANGKVNVVVTAEDGTTIRTYTITVNRAKSNDATLSGLTVNPGTLAPVFNSNTQEYDVTVGKQVTELQVTATVNEVDASLTINGVAATSGTAKTVTIPANGKVNVVVTAEDGTTIRTYTITVNRAVSNDATLSGLTVNPGTLAPVFNSLTLEYAVTVAAGVNGLQVTATVTDSNASLVINGEVATSGTAKTVTIPADGKINVVVTAEDGTTKKTYKIHVNRQQNPGPVDPGPGPGPGPIVDPPPPPPVGDPLDLGKNAVIEKVKEADGGTTVNITLTKETVVNALKSKEAETKPLFVELKEQANQYVLQLSKEIVEMLKKGNADVILKSDIINVTIPTGSIDISSIPVGSIVKIKVSKASEIVKKTLFDSAILQTRGALKPLNNAISIGMEVQTGDQSSELKWNSKNGLLIEWSVDDKNKEALYQYNTVSNKWTFVQTESSMNLQSAGLFAVMAYENTFGDVKNHWAKSEIEWMAQRLLVTGYTKDEFKPNQAITRGEFTVLLVRALGLTFEDNGKPNSFTDVSKNHVNYQAVEAAFAAGIVKGKGDGTFAPTDPITREQMTMMITRAYVKLGLAAANSGDLALLEKFEDRERISSWAKSDIALAIKEGLVKGRTESLFDPKGLATRAHAVVMIIRILQKIE